MKDAAASAAFRAVGAASVLLVLLCLSLLQFLLTASSRLVYHKLVAGFRPWKMGEMTAFDCLGQ